MDNFFYQKLEIVKDLKWYEKAIKCAINMFGYGFGTLPLLHHLTTKGLAYTSKGFRNQTVSYVENGEIIYRRLESKNGLVEDFNGFQTMKEYIEYIFTDFSKNACMGSRDVIEKEEIYDEEIKKPVMKQVLSDFKWKTYEQIYTEIIRISNYFRQINLSQQNRFAIFCDTCEEWIVSALSAINVGSTVITMYNSMSNEHIEYILKLTKPVCILVDYLTISRFSGILQSIPSIKTVLCSSRATQNSSYVSTYMNDSASFVYLKDITGFGNHTIVKENITNKIEPSDLATICFTSGSRGDPKGVSLTHKNLLAIIASAVTLEKYWVDIVLPSYLPLAHILELTLELIVLSKGKSIGYCSVSTMTDTSFGLMKGCKGDLTLLKPTAFVAVPLILDRIKKGVMDKIKASSRIRQLIFQTSYNIRAYYFSRGYETPIINKLIFGKIRNALGGRVKYGLMGSAVISRDTEEWFQVCFGPFKQGYGCTETCGISSMSNVDYYTPGNSGPPYCCCEIKLVNWEEGGYLSDDPTGPKGEIAVHGPNIAAGYFNEEELTKESFRTDPVTGKLWFYTGDIGEILIDGTVRIIDRKKDLAKLIHGEYISLSQIESSILTSKYVDNCFVSPDSKNERIICIATPNINALNQLAGSLNIEFSTILLSDLIRKNQIMEAITNDILQILNKKKLNKFEIPSKIIMVGDAWTPESGLVTSSLKTRRVQLLKTYADILM